MASGFLESALDYSDMNLRIAAFTLGCKVNQYDTEAIISRFLANGFHLVPFSEKAEVYLINTCTVTAKGDRKSKNAVRRAGRINPQAKIIVTGCLVQRCPESVSDLPGVVLVAGNPEKEKIFSLFNKAINSGERQILVTNNKRISGWDNLKTEQFYRRTRAFIKIQDGCDASCRYCLIPQVRGKPRSRPLFEVKEEIKRFTEHKFKEIVLTGIRLGRYGEDLNPVSNLAELLKDLETEIDLLRIRLSSLAPGEFSRELIEQISKGKKICPHFHIPLQSGDNDILCRMGRRYIREEYLNLIKRIKKEIPLATFSTDIIVGFPGEEESHFQNTIDLVKNVGFIHLHIFVFSPRTATEAAFLPGQVRPEIKKERSQRLHRLSGNLKEKYWAGQEKDKELEVLVEKKGRDGKLTGLTRNYLRVNFSGNADLINRLVKIRLGQAELSEIRQWN